MLLAEVKGKDITELIASGREKLASVPSGGGAAVAVAAPGGGGAAAPAAAEPKKEEKVEEKEESDDVRLLLLFLNSNIFLGKITIIYHLDWPFCLVYLTCCFLFCLFFFCRIWVSVSLTERSGRWSVCMKWNIFFPS